MGGGQSVPTAGQVTASLQQNKIESNGFHLADFHSKFHSSGMCIGSFIIIILLIVTLFYCFRKRNCPQHFERNPNTQIPMYSRQPPVPASSLISNLRRSIHRSAPDKTNEWSPASHPNV